MKTHSSPEQRGGPRRGWQSICRTHIARLCPQAVCVCGTATRVLPRARPPVRGEKRGHATSTTKGRQGVKGQGSTELSGGRFVWSLDNILGVPSCRTMKFSILSHKMETPSGQFNKPIIYSSLYYDINFTTKSLN